MIYPTRTSVCLLFRLVDISQVFHPPSLPYRLVFYMPFDCEFLFVVETVIVYLGVILLLAYAMSIVIFSYSQEEF